MVAGRPRLYDREKLAESIIEWAKKDSSMNLNAFCYENDLDPDQVIDWAAEKGTDFSRAYRIAKSFIAVRREERASSGQLHQKAYAINADVYDRILRAERREEKRFDAELNKEVVQAQSKEQLEALDNMQSMLRMAQEAYSERKIADNSIKSDA